MTAESAKVTAGALKNSPIRTTNSSKKNAFSMSWKDILSNHRAFMRKQDILTGVR